MSTPRPLSDLPSETRIALEQAVAALDRARTVLETACEASTKSKHVAARARSRAGEFSAQPSDGQDQQSPS
jgi:hypothetical protein